jgi:hypothetical protein
MNAPAQRPTPFRGEPAAARKDKGYSDRWGIVSPDRLRRTGRFSHEQEEVMGRTATAFLVLIAMGGCVADDSGPSTSVLVSRTGQPATPPNYATWNRTGQFAVLQEDMALHPVSGASAPAPLTKESATVVQKPSSLQKQAPTTAPLDVVPPPAVLAQVTTPPGAVSPNPARPTVGQPAPLAVDSQLVAATMVQAPVDSPALAPIPEPEPVPAKTQSVVVHPPLAPTPDPVPEPVVVKTQPTVVHPILPPVPEPVPEPVVVKTQPAGVHQAAPNPEAEQTTVTPGPGSPSIRVVNSKRITLNYELKDVGSSGVSGVELWCTQDGHSWKKGDIFAQTNHSFSTEVKDEGLHGFSILARNGSGLGKDAPTPGEQPQVWVMVDITKPVVQITAVEINHNGKVPTVQMRWTAKDKNLGPRPITLSFAEQPEGPWSVIAAGVENSGQFDWQAPANAPRRLYIRVEAADMPGNVGATQTANPLRLDAAVTIAPPPPAIDTSRPSAAISGIEPGN